MFDEMRSEAVSAENTSFAANIQVLEQGRHGACPYGNRHSVASLTTKKKVGN
jgi:hypothetical protein